MLSPRVAEGHQIPLIHEVHADDQYLLDTLDGEWFEILYDLPWEGYRPHAAAYYEALYAFNMSENLPPVGERASGLSTCTRALLWSRNSHGWRRKA